MNVDQAANLSSSFGLAAERCLEARPQVGGTFQMLVVPAVVCAAFSSELGLKTLLLMNGREGWGHDLRGLFLKLDATDQAAVVRAAGVERRPSAHDVS